MEELNGNGKIKMEHRITKIEECQKNQDEKIDYVKTQVSNHLPHQIKAVNEKVNELMTAFNGFQIKNQKWINRILLAVVMLFLSIIASIII